MTELTPEQDLQLTEDICLDKLASERDALRERVKELEGQMREAWLELSGPLHELGDGMPFDKTMHDTLKRVSGMLSLKGKDDE